MTKEVFLYQLKLRLSQLSDSEIDERLAYYREMIDDMVEDGMSEEEAVSSFGDVKQVAAQIMQEAPLSSLMKSRFRPKKGWTVATIAAAVVGAPLWIPLLFALLAVLAAVYLSVWAVAAACFAGVFALGIAGIAVFIKGFQLSAFGAGDVVFSIGAGLFLLGLGCIAFLLIKAGTLSLLHFTKWSFMEIKGLFIKKEVNK